MKKRLIVLLVTVVLAVGFLPVQVSANSAPPEPFYIFHLTNLPEGAVYADLLIPLRENDENYVEINRNQLPDSFDENAEIIDFHIEGYCSYTFHYRDAVSSISLNEEGKVAFFADAQFLKDWSGESNIIHQYEISGLGYVRIAILDKFGNVLDVSPFLSVHKKGVFSYLDNSFVYDAEIRKFHVEYRTSYFGIYVYLILAFSGMILTCFAEWLAAIPFGLDKEYRWMIEMTNVFSQILMHALYLLLYGVVFWKYKHVVILLEVLVYAGEYLWYSRCMWDIPKKKVLAYTAVANTISLVLGMVTTYSLILKQ